MTFKKARTLICSGQEEDRHCEVGELQSQAGATSEKPFECDGQEKDRGATELGSDDIELTDHSTNVCAKDYKSRSADSAPEATNDNSKKSDDRE